MSLNSILKRVWWQWQWLKLHFWAKWMQAWSAIHHGSPELNCTEVTLQVTDTEKGKWGKFCSHLLHSLSQAGHGLWLLPCFGCHDSAVFTWQLRCLLFLTLKKIVFCGVFPPLLYSEIWLHCSNTAPVPWSEIQVLLVWNIGIHRQY